MREATFLSLSEACIPAALSSRGSACWRLKPRLILSRNLAARLEAVPFQSVVIQKPQSGAIQKPSGNVSLRNPSLHGSIDNTLA